MAIKKTAEATGNLIGNKIGEKITCVSKKKLTKELRDNDKTEEDAEYTYLSKKEKTHY